MTTLKGDTNFPSHNYNPHIEEKLVRDEQTNDLYLPLTSTVVPKREQKMLYVPFDFKNNLTTDALVELRASVSAIAQNEFDTIKQQALNKILKNDDTPNFQKQVGNCQLEKLLAAVWLEIDVGENTLDEKFVVVEKMTVPIKGLHFRTITSVVINTTHGHKHFLHLTMQVKTPSSETRAEPQAALTDNAVTIPPEKTKAITTFVD